LLNHVNFWISLNHAFLKLSNPRTEKQKLFILKIRNMKTKILSILMVAMFVFSIAAVAQRTTGQQKSERQEMMKPGMKHDAKKANFLTEEQKEALGKLRLETEKEMKPFKNELRELKAHQQTLTTAENADLKAINKNIDKMAELKAEMAKIMAKQHQAFRSQLTEEQLIKFDNRRNRMNAGTRNKDHGKRYDFGRENSQNRGA
jgi:Spy/CpxP family protein refolding chaperone